MWGQFFPEKEKKALRLKAKTEYLYRDNQANNLIKVTRIDDGKGSKNFFQSHLNSQNKWVNGVPDEVKAQVSLYQINHPINQQAIANGGKILVVEGESCVEALLSLSIAATTSIGGSGKWHKYGHDNYVEALQGAHIVICPDRDKAGIKHAQAIAQDFPECEWLYVKPESSFWENLPESGGLDALDWIAELRSEGLNDDAICKHIYAEIEAGPRSMSTSFPSSSLVPCSQQLKPHFETSLEEGLQWITYKQVKTEGGERTERRVVTVGNHLEAIAYVESPHQEQAALYIKLKDLRNRQRQVTLPRSAIVDGNETFKLLNSLGYEFKLKSKAKLRDYLNGLGGQCKERFVITPKTGWVDHSFVTPDQTYGDQSLRFGQVEPPKQARFAQAGTLEEWKKHVASQAQGNSRLVLSLGCAFGAPLLDLLGLESGGLHFVGESSRGKTTAANLAASVYGSVDSVVTQWRATANGLEGQALASNDLCFILDEIGQALPRDVGNCAYMLANGQSKIRMKRNRQIDDAKKWRLLFLSTGEVSLTDYLSQAGLPVKAGQESRMPSIPACPENGHGVFEDIKGQPPGDFVRELERSIAQYHGTAFHSFISQLVPALDHPDFKADLLQRHSEYAKMLAQVGEGDEVIGRVAKRFAAIQLGLELAADWEILPLTSEDIHWGVHTCFNDWIGSRGGIGSIEIKQACECIQHLFISNEHSDRIHLIEGGERIVRNLLAHKSEDEFWVPTSVFNKELVGNCNRKSLIKELQDRGWLKRSTQSDRNTLKRSVNGIEKNFFVFDFQNLEKTTGVAGNSGFSMQAKESMDSRQGNSNGFQRESIESSEFKTPEIPVMQNETGALETPIGHGHSRDDRDSRQESLHLKIDPSIVSMEFPDLGG